MSELIARNDFPRPQFERSSWVNLNGEWEFEFDDARVGDRERWFMNHDFSGRIQVPFSFQSKLSGIGDTGFHDVVWYRRQVEIPDEFAGKRILLHFGAVDYLSWVWVNGQLVHRHEGGHTPFQIDITDALQKGGNSIVVKAEDFSRDLTLPNGKQYWKEHSEGIWYTRTTGIWQTVWMETVADVYLDRVMMTPDIDRNAVQIRSFVKGELSGRDVRLTASISFQGTLVAEETILQTGAEAKRSIGLDVLGVHEHDRLWSPEQPNLYDVVFTLTVEGKEADRVTSYFGMRSITVENGKICLNHHPYFMKMVLDQGYFPDGNLTPPSDDAIKRDVELTKALGFNGARKHQKIEDPRYMYWCDKLGLLVWGEMANSIAYSEDYARKFTLEWQQAVERDYNHPCIVAWVPLNESWGVPNISSDKAQQHHALAMYHFIKSLDTTRLVISNDGWEHTKSDIFTIHDYESRREVLEDRYQSTESALRFMPASRSLAVPGYPYDGAPIHISEFGGISYKKSDWEGWGYSNALNDRDYIDRYAAVTAPLLHSPVVQGYCYTQLTDVEQEINGLLTYDREPKVPLDIIKQLNEGKIPEPDQA